MNTKQKSNHNANHATINWKRRVSMSTLIVTTMISGLACGGHDSSVPESGLANVNIKQLASDKYDSYKFSMKPQSGGSGTTIETKTFTKTDNKPVEVTVVPGKYQITLDYYKGTEKVFGAEMCPDGIRNNAVELKSGPNPLKITICDLTQSAVNAEVTIEPEIYKGAGSSALPPETGGAGAGAASTTDQCQEQGAKGPSTSSTGSDPLPPEANLVPAECTPIKN